MKVLLVEDEPALHESLVVALQSMGMVTESAQTLEAASEKVAMHKYDVVVLDIGLPDGSGMKLLNQLKKLNPDSGVLILSAKNSLDDKLEGLSLGADDYLTKPFHTAELIARIKALHRRRQMKGKMQLDFGELSLFPEEKLAHIGGMPLDLTPKEFELLLYFASNQDRVMTRADIAEHLWGDLAESFDDFDFIYAHVKNLRKKIADSSGPDCIKTIYGTGYKFTLK
jgi:DNA-binding response OmpR family regulator